MLRSFACALLALVFMAGGLLAEEVKGKLKSVDAAKNTITVTVGDKDTTYPLAADAKIVNAQGKEIKNGLSAKPFQNVNGKQQVTLTTATKDGKEVVTELKMGGGKKKENN
jgi:hypothetical protein